MDIFMQKCTLNHCKCKLKRGSNGGLMGSSEPALVYSAVAFHALLLEYKR